VLFADGRRPCCSPTAGARAVRRRPAPCRSPPVGAGADRRRPAVPIATSGRRAHGLAGPSCSL